MTKKGFVFGLSGAALLIGLMFAGCGSAPKAADLTGVTSYYVRANGNDKNAGISEDAPFKTPVRAVEAAAKTTVKKITVIGTLVENVKIAATDSTIKLPTKFMDVTGEKSIEEVMANQVGVATINWSLDEGDPDEILITCKPGASAVERAVLTPASNDPKAVATLTIANSTVRLANIEISGMNSNGDMSVILVAFGTLTLEQGTKITKNVSAGATGIFAVGGVVIMRDDAEFSGNEGKDNAGFYLDRGSVAVMFGKSLISGNKAKGGNGGGVALQGSSLLMHDDAAITGNSTGNAGDGIITFTDTENGYISQITMSGNGGWALRFRPLL
jgi:hypothetical protein